MMKKCLSVSICIMLLGVLLVSSGNAAKAKTTSTEPIKIGAIIPYTGMDPTAPVHIDNGIKMALDEVGWQIADKKIKYFSEDSAFDPVVAVNKAKKLVQQNEVDVVIGPLLVSCSVAVANYLTASRIPQLVLAELPLFAQRLGGKNIFSSHGEQKKTYYLGLYAYDELGYRTATVLHADFVAGNDLAQGFIDGFESKGGVIVQRQRTPLGTMDYAPYVSALKDADCFAQWVIPGEDVRLLKSYYYSYNKTLPVLEFALGTTDKLLAQIGDKTVGMIAQGTWDKYYDIPANKKFVADYVKKYGEDPNYLAAMAYEMALIFIEAVKATGGDTRPEVINDAIRNVEIDSPTGKMSFNDEGIGIGNLNVCQVIKINGTLTWKPIYTYEQVLYVSPVQK